MNKMPEMAEMPKILDRKPFARDLEKRMRVFAVNIIRLSSTLKHTPILGIFGILGNSSPVGNLGISFRVGILAHFWHFSSRHFPQAGLAYVAILVLLAIMSTLAMAFLFKAGTLRAVTVNRLAGMQADYLAEAAANHALWRLLNDPGFPASESTYYMHDLGTGRYGYKVRKPTLTTFATVATVGTVGSTVAKQGYVQYIKPENILATYDRHGDAIPKYRQMIGANWSDQADTVNDGTLTAQWMVLRGYPKSDRKEFIMGTLDNDQDINFAVWNGSTWGNVFEFTENVGSTQYRCFDIAYENLSGRALVLGRYDNSMDVKYNIWTGTAWTFVSAQNAYSTGLSYVAYATMASKPASNEILIGTITLANDLKLVLWDGTAFTDLGVIDTDTQEDGYGSVDIVFEQQSGDALIIWSHKNTSRFYYAIWNGAVLSSPALGPDFGKPFNVVRAAADPAGDYIFIAAVDSFNDLNVAVWDGSAWIDSRELDTSTNGNTGQILDVAWEQAGQDVLVAWISNSSQNNVTYFSWQKGTALADHAVRLGPAIGAPGDLIRMLPVSGTQKIVLLIKNGARHLLYSLWTGSGFSGNPAIQLDNNLSLGILNFDAAESGVPYTGGAG